MFPGALSYHHTGGLLGMVPQNIYAVSVSAFGPVRGGSTEVPLHPCHARNPSTKRD